MLIKRSSSSFLTTLTAESTFLQVQYTFLSHLKHKQLHQMYSAELMDCQGVSDNLSTLSLISGCYQIQV